MMESDQAERGVRRCISSASTTSTSRGTSLSLILHAVVPSHVLLTGAYNSTPPDSHMHRTISETEPVLINLLDRFVAYCVEPAQLTLPIRISRHGLKVAASLPIQVMFRSIKLSLPVLRYSPRDIDAPRSQQIVHAMHTSV